MTRVLEFPKMPTQSPAGPRISRGDGAPDWVDGVRLDRGVYIAPWMDDEGQMVLVALTDAGRLACEPVSVNEFDTPQRAADALWAILDRVNPDSGDAS